MNEIKEYTIKLFEDIKHKMNLVMNIGWQENCKKY